MGRVANRHRATPPNGKSSDEFKKHTVFVTTAWWDEQSCEKTISNVRNKRIQMNTHVGWQTDLYVHWGSQTQVHSSTSSDVQTTNGHACGQLSSHIIQQTRTDVKTVIKKHVWRKFTIGFKPNLARSRPKWVVSQTDIVQHLRMVNLQTSLGRILFVSPRHGETISIQSKVLQVFIRVHNLM